MAILKKSEIANQASRKPIKRSSELIPLSREHHDGLLFCWKIRMGLKNKIEPFRITSYILNFYETALAGHFQEEEVHIFTLLPDTDKLKLEALSQHRLLEGYLKKISLDKTNIVSIRVIADELEKHIRFEERVLFNHIEKTVPVQVFNNLGAKLRSIDAKKCKHTLSDEFWINKK